MPKLDLVGAVIVDLRNEAISAQKKHRIFMGYSYADAAIVFELTTKALKKLAVGDAKGFVKVVQSYSAWHSDTFDYVVSELFERLNVVGSYDDGYGKKLPCWEDFEAQFLK